jgi:hypothetical protein
MAAANANMRFTKPMTSSSTDYVSMIRARFEFGYTDLVFARAGVGNFHLKCST